MTVAHFPSPHSLSPIATSPFAAVTFTQYILFSYGENIIRHTKRQINKTKQNIKNPQFEETKQASETDMAGMLGLSNQEFKTTTIILSILTSKN